MSQDPVDELLDSARQFGLLSARDAATLSRELRESGVATRQDAAARLVGKQVLTLFQAEQLLGGHGAECVLAGRYFVRDNLGAGAMGAVYLAEDRKLDRLVAIKVLPAQSVTDAGAVARFQREAKALARLSHPNIIQAYDSDEDAGRQFLVMEYAEGTNLGDLIRAKGRIAPALAADYVYQAALGLQSAHQKGLVHRDLKPGNLLLTHHGHLKILDLGLARFLQDNVGDATLTREGMGMGTPDYMAPEQFHDARHVDARSDIYSLGCTLYHLIAGRVPFPGTSMSEKYAAHEQREAAALEEFCRDVPAGLSLAVERMMAKRPGDRFQSAREVAEALFPHVSGSSHAIVQVKATASWHGSQLGLRVEPIRVQRRRRVVVATGMAVACTVLLALVSWLIGFFPNSGRRSTADTGVVSNDGKMLLTVSKDPAKRGEFRSINEALDKVTRPGMTVRVLDDAEYHEAIQLTNPRSFAQLTLEAPAHAAIVAPAGKQVAIRIANVPRVTVRGFRVRSASQTDYPYLCHVSGTCPGVVIEGIECRGGNRRTFGVQVESLSLTTNDPPLQIRNCVFTSMKTAVAVVGLNVTARQPTAVNRVTIQGNRIYDCDEHGIVLTGRVNDVAILANRVGACGVANIVIGDLLEGSNRILIANNTLQNPRDCLRVSDPMIDVPDVQVVNNLILSDTGPDLAYTGSEPQVLKGWRIANNYRQHQPTNSADELQRWLPLDKDRIGQQLVPLSLDPTSPDFLAPPKTADLSTTESLDGIPGYIGAVPPEGTEPWDWQKIWQDQPQSGSGETKQEL